MAHTDAHARHPRRSRSAAGGLLLVAAIAAVCAGLLPSHKVPTRTTFVDRALGSPSADASLERHLVTGTTLAVNHAGIDARAGSQTITLAWRSARHSDWQRYDSGVTRTTSFGRESVLFGINRAEQFLTVNRRLGTRTWRWRLDATHGTPHVGDDGGVSFTRAGRLAGFHILPVAIFSSDGRDVTPAGLRWSLNRNASGWTLGLQLDDKRLPLPYLIDPIALIAACALPVGAGGTTSCTAATSTGSSSLGITKPSAAVAGDVMTAQVVVRSTGAISAPAGWSQVGTTAQDATGPIEQAVFWHLVDGTEPATIAFTWAGGNADASGGIATYKGADPFIGFDQGGSAVTSLTSGGTAATGNPAGLAITTSAANEMLQAAYGVANGATITQSAGQTIAREWTVASTGTTKVTAGFSDNVQATAGASGNKTATWVTSSLWTAQLYALKNEAADGTGTVAATFLTASASQTGLTQTLTYTPAAGSMANGDVSFVVPAGWTAPQATTAGGAGYVTATGGSGTDTIAVTGTGPWTVTVSGVTLNQGTAQTLVMKYGDKSGGGAGATGPATTGGVAWTTKQRSSSRGTLTSLAAQPTITVYAADGTGTIASSLSAVSGSQAGLTETLTYTVAAGSISNGTLTVAVPAGWTAPATVAGPGYTTSTLGVVSVAGQTITVSGITRTAGQTVVITYGSGATATATSSAGAQTWQVSEASTAGGVLTAIGTSSSIAVYAPDGSGTATTPTTNVSASQTGYTVAFTYTVAAGDMFNGGVKLTIPTGWTAPSTTSNNAGYTTASAGTVSTSAQVVTVAGLTLTVGSTVTITYGSTAGGGSGAKATGATGAQTWQVQEHSTAGGVFTNLGTSPAITVNAANGSGTLTASIANVSASEAGRTITFTYTAATGGTNGGAVTVVAPAGWSAPSTTPTDAGYTTSSTGTVSVAGQTITVSGVTLAAAATVTVVYGNTGASGPGATAGATTGAQTWQAQEKSTAAGVLANLAASPSITVYAPDGSGTTTSSISGVSAGQTGRTVTLTYTAATGGMLTGSLTVTVPSGWTAPATSAGPGYTTSSVGTVSVAGQTITITGITRTAAQTVVVTYGSGGTATAASTAGAQAWQIQEASTSGGVLTSIATPPVLTVYAADGSGTLSASTSNVSASQTGNTIAFTFTAPAGGINGGTVTVVVPTGWSAPKTLAGNAGYTTASTGTVSAASQTITVSGVTLAGAATMTITYGDTSGGPGATATATTGAQTWQGQERSTAPGVLTNLGASPSITINAANGSGTMSVLPANVGNSSTGNTLTFTYTAATGGLASGAVTVTAPAGWSAPSTTATDAGYTTASTGSVSTAGQTITVSGVTLAGAATLTIVFGNTGGGGPGATAGATAGANSFQTQERSTSGGVLANIGASPSVNVYAADGSGTMTTATANVVNGSANTIVFTYKAAAAGGISNGSVRLTVPAGWPAPTAGNTTSSLGSRTYAGQTVTVSSVTLAVNATFTITYGPAAAPTTGGAQTWSATERSTAAGTLAALTASPSVNIYAADGSGTLTGAPSPVGYGSAGNTETFTYTAAAGGTSAAAVTVVVPAGWNAPSTVSGNAGYTVASTGIVSVAAQTITVSTVTLAAGATLTITYGSGAPGATAPSVAGPQTWQAKSKASVGGTLTNLAGSPSITVAQPPTSARTFPAAAALYSTASWTAGCAGAGFCGTASDNSGAGLQKVELTIRQGAGNYWNGTSFSSGTPVFVLASGTSSWSYAFPASSFPADGTYTVQTRATDNLNGVETSTSTTFTVDLTPPSAFSLSAPTAAFVGATAIVSATAADAGSGIAQLEFRYCAGTSCSFAAGTTIGSPVATSGFASKSWDLSSLTNGAQYTVVARATDAAGNTTDSAPTTVTLDETAPTTTDNAPAGTQSSAVTVTLSPGDSAGSGVASTSYRTDGGSWHVGTSVLITAPADHSNDGSHTIDYASTDDVGNVESTRHATVTIDTQGPSGAPLDPGSVLAGTVVLSDSSPSDSGAGLASVAFQYSPHGAGTWTTIGTATSAPWSTSFDTTALTDGLYDLRELVSDAASPANVTTVDLAGPKAIDNTPPSSASVTAPAVAAVVGGTVTLTATASDATSGAGQMVFKVNGTVVGTSAGSPASVNWDSTSTADGPVSVTVAAKDVAGNGPTVSTGRAIVVDNNPPTVTLASPGGAVHGTVALTTTTSADTTQVTFERSAAGAGTWTTIAVVNSPPLTASLNTALLTDGLYDLRAIASDGTHLVTSNVVTTRIDNTSPTGSVTTPAAGATVGGSSAALTANPSDLGSGVATVQFRVDGTPVGTVSASPWLLSWDPSSTPSGAHTIDAVVTDAAGNSTTTAGVAVTVDSTPPTVTLTDPGALVSGSITLQAASPDSDTARVDFQVSAAGAGIWTTVATDSTSPFSHNFDTTTVSDGLYDFRALARDGVGNVSAPGVVASRRIDNTPPSYVSASPADGSTIGSASSISVTAGEALGGVTGLTLDGGATTAPAISGATATVATGPLADGPHTLAGTFVDLAGKTSAFTTHFTILSGTPPADWPYVEMNALPGVTATLDSTDTGASITTDGAYSSSSDHRVLRVDPNPPAVVDGGFATDSLVYDVSYYWSLTGVELHSVASPLEIVLANPSGANLVPTTFQNGVWRPIPLVETPGVLPPGWSDGYYNGSGGVHILTRHLSDFTLLNDRFPPTPPHDVVGVVAPDGLTLRWLPGVDSSGPLAHVQLYVDGTVTTIFDPTQFETKLGPILAGDPRTFSFTETDAAGNVSDTTTALRALPLLAGRRLDAATQALAASGFAPGTIAEVPSAAPAGTVVGPADVEVLPLGSRVDLAVSTGPKHAAAVPFRLQPLGPATFRPTRGMTIGGAVAVTKPATVTIALVDPHGRRLATWSRPLRAGLNYPQLRLPTSARNLLIRHPGLYWLSWVAAGEQANERLRLRVVVP
jgi:hypothetical protein